MFARSGGVGDTIATRKIVLCVSFIILSSVIIDSSAILKIEL
jgi:hypothetical protein